MLSATGSRSWGILWAQGTPWNHTYSTNIADTTLELDVRPESGPVLLQVDLSYHPARRRPPLPGGQYLLRYRFGARPARWFCDGPQGFVDVPAVPGHWQRFRLTPVEDVARLWPGVAAADNSLKNLRIGIEARAGAAVRGAVDRLLFHRTRRHGQAGEQLRRSVLAEYSGSYRGIVHHRAYEISLTRHLNWYGGDQTMPAFPSPPFRDNDPDLTEAMVRWLHGHGGVVCWNHPLDAGTRESVATLMVTRHALGVDPVEIGRRRLEDLLWVFDVAARNAVLVTAVGASDDHDGIDWLDLAEPWITQVWAWSTRRPHLVDALRRGRAWFADPRSFRGTLDLTLGDRPALGSVLLTDDRTVPVTVHATDLPAGSTLEVITGRVDRAGTAELAPAVTVRPLTPIPFGKGWVRVPVSPGSGTYLRTQVRMSDGAVAAVSNPLWLLPPQAGVPASRRMRW